MSARKPRVLVFIVAYNAEKTIENVLTRIPAALGERYEAEILIIDDSSKDRTFEKGELARRARALPFPLHVFFNPANQGYGGNQKIGFQYAIERGFDFVALVHGDGQYAPECLPQLLEPLARGEADAVFGSRMLASGAALRGGMPFYKYAGNKTLTRYQNAMLRTRLSEFHSGYRIYRVAALARIPFAMNTNVFHFDTEIIIQLVIAGLRIREEPIPTYYGDEICHVDGLKYAWDVFLTTLKARLQEVGLFYDPKYDCAPLHADERRYQAKFDYPSPHTFVLEHVPPGAHVLDLGCAGGYLSEELARRGTRAMAVDVAPLGEGVRLDNFVRHDLNLPLPFDASVFDYVVALDVIEHLRDPEAFVRQLRESLGGNPKVTLIASTGNIAFVIPRLMLLLGQFNYGKRGILDLTHTRLFTIRSFRRLFLQAGYDVASITGIPAPFPLALGGGRTARFLVWLNRLLIRLSPSLFAYQFVLVVRPRPSLPILLKDAVDSAAERSAAL